MITPLRVGVVGLGWAGQQHLDAYQRSGGVEIVAIAGKEAALLEQLGEKYAVTKRFSAWEDLLVGAPLDAISIAVPTFLHAPIAIQALRHGLHVLSEKPIARNGTEAATMVAAARSAGRVLEVVFNHRRRGAVQALKTVMDSGAIGHAYYAHTSWLRRSGIPTLGSWFTNKNMSGGGPLIDIGVHALDYALHLLGEPEVVAVSAAAYSELGRRGRGGEARATADATVSDFDVEDFAMAFLRLRGGGSLVLEASWAAYRQPTDEMGFRVLATDGGAEILSVSTHGSPAEEVRIYTEQDGADADYVLPQPPDAGHLQVVADFLHTITGNPAEWSSHDGSLALARAKIIDACYMSARENREVRL